MKKFYSKNFFKILTLGLVVAATAGCKKDRNPDIDQQAAEDNVQAEYVFSDVNNIVDDAARSQGGVNKMLGNNFGCANITMTYDNPADTASFPRTLTCIWDSACTPANTKENIRKGKMIIRFTDRYSKTGAIVTTTFDKFSVNGYTVDGKRTLTNNGNGGFTVAIEGGKVVSSSGKEILINTNNTKTILDDKGTDLRSDDKYQITGSSNGTSGGKTFTAEITEPLIVDRKLCKWITKGKLTIKPLDKEARLVDFGTGTCDDEATVTIGGFTAKINMP